MATQQTKLYELRNDAETLLMGVEWDDVTLNVIDFAFRLNAGNRSATFTLTRTSDGAQRTHQFVPGVNYVLGTVLRWNPPFPLTMQLYTNPKTSQVVGIANGWSAEIALD
jgi:hypothetical protein